MFNLPKLLWYAIQINKNAKHSNITHRYIHNQQPNDDIIFTGNKL